MVTDAMPTHRTAADHGPDRQLVVNADDFGQSREVNLGVVRTHERGIVTSASLMVLGRAAAEAARYGSLRTDLSLGLHIDLGEWRYRRGGWELHRPVLDEMSAASVEREVARQLDLFRRLAGREPTHLDSHQHVHRDGPAAVVAADAARALGVPLRGVGSDVSYRGDFYGQTSRGAPCHGAVTFDALAQVIRALRSGVTEMSCHPGVGIAPDDVYGFERVLEVGVLCDPRLGGVLAEAGVGLCRFDRMRVLSGSGA